MEGEQSPLPPELGEDGPMSWSLVRSSGLARPDGLWDEHIQAKRARVETIVRGMCLSPQPLVPGDARRARGGPACLEKARAHRRKQNVPAHQGPLRSGAARKAGPRAAEQLRGQLPHLQEHSGQVAGPQRPAGSNKAKGPGSGQQQPACCRPVPWSVDCNHGHGAGRNRSRVEEARATAVQCLSEPSFPPPGTQALLERLREELPGAVSQAVDAVLQKILLDPLHLPAQWDRNFQVLVPRGRREPSPPGTGVHPESLASAALPRRVQLQAGVPWGDWPMAKPLESPHHPGSSSSTPMPYQAPPAECPLAGPSYIQESELLGQLLGSWSGSVRQRSPLLSHPSSESVPAPWEAAPPTSSVPNQQQQRSLPVTAPSLGRFPFLPKVRMEQRHLPAVTEAPAFAPGREGLTPGHLKKAKLMFFFTRYPSSNLLKACFPDVQFNRCITSQMIKWFSNFREFYYIQMEKSARQAISDGITNPKMLVVLRDSELFRALNTHYNKGNDFEVPDCFLEIASLTFQEFFRAVSAGKDTDPSWKKPIYKIISKLDSDIPEIFKSSSYPQELLQS